MEFIILLMPILVSSLTNWIKNKVPVVATLQSGSNRKLTVRAIVAFLSLGTTIGTYSLTGELDANAIQVGLGTFGTALTSILVYQFGKKKKKDVLR